MNNATQVTKPFIELFQDIPQFLVGLFLLELSAS